MLANRPPPEGLWKRTKFYVKKAIGAVFDGIRVTLETFGVIEETTAVERLAKDPRRNSRSPMRPARR